MKAKNIILMNSLITASVVVAQIEYVQDQLWDDESSSWEDIYPSETTKSLEGRPVYETVTVTTTWVPPDINQWAHPADYFATTTTEYDTEEEAEMALERSGGKKKYFRRKKKHFKKKHHHKIVMLPQVYLNQQQSRVVDASVGMHANADVMSLQEADVVMDNLENPSGSVVAASAYSLASDISSNYEVAATWTELAQPSGSIQEETVLETPFPKVLLNSQADVDAVSSSASALRNTILWTVGSIAVACYVALS